MFLGYLRRRNLGLIEQAIAFHQAGAIPANSYVIDLDAVTENAQLIRAEADRAGLKIFAMTKQMGRNGDFCRAVKAGGVGKAVAVDMECARACTRAGLGHRKPGSSRPGASPRGHGRGHWPRTIGRYSTRRRPARRRPRPRLPGAASAACAPPRRRRPILQRP